jgi:D-amino-acid oxidase
MTIRVTVAGAGIAGLTCAVRLAEAGLRVDVLARELPLETSSAAGGGLWLPPRAEPSPEPWSGSAAAGAADVARWARTTLRELRNLAGSPAGEEAGVVLRPGLMLGPSAGAALRAVSDDTGPVPVSAPAPGRASGWRVVLPVVDLDRYLPHLVRRLEAAGGTLTRLALAALPTRGVVVNCTGVAARAMAPDPGVTPARAQVVRLAAPPDGLGEWWHDATPGAECWVAPHGGHVVVGGPVEPGEWSPTPDPATAERLRERAARLVPALRDAAFLGHRVGLRPMRATVRLATERRDAALGGDPYTVVHCYGHGASGLALSWGTADDVLAAVRAVAGIAEPATAG